MTQLTQIITKDGKEIFVSDWHIKTIESLDLKPEDFTAKGIHGLSALHIKMMEDDNVMQRLQRQHENFINSQG